MGHLSWGELERRQAQAATVLPLGKKIEHYKTRDIYQIIGHCIIEKSDEVGILYSAVGHSEVTFMRPWLEFFELVELDGAQVERFRIVED